MSVEKRRNQNAVRRYYFPDRLRKRLAMIPGYPVTIVEAPSGFGKTTAVREYLKNALDAAEDTGGGPEFKSVWSIIGEENRRNEWDIFCRAVKNADSNLGAELETLSFLQNDGDLGRMREILQNAEEKEDTFIVIDNYQFVQERIPTRIMEGLFQSLPAKLHLVLVTQLANPVPSALTGSPKVNHVQRNSLTFDAEDIRAFYRLHNFGITKSQAEEIRAFTDGWAVAVYLTLLRYAEEGKISGAGGLRKLIEDTVWNKLSENERNFLFRMSRFDSFDAEQARFMSEAGGPDPKIDKIDKKILAMLEGNGFVFYRPEENRYFIHSILQEYVRREFETEPQPFKINVLRRTAGWHESQRQNLLAVKYYSAVDDFGAMLKMSFASSDFTATASAENKALLLSVLDRCPRDVLMEHPKALAVFAFALFVYSETERLLALRDEARRMLSASSAPEEEKNKLAGELEFLTAFLAHNDFAKMAEGYRRAWELLKAPTSVINRKGPWTFGSPSILYMFYRRNAEADTACLEENLPAYCRVASGHGTGADILMRGELQFNQGRLADAKVAAHKALYAAEETEQVNFVLCARFLLAQIAAAEGDADGYKLQMKTLKETAEASKLPVYATMADLCLGFLHAVTDGVVPCPEWLRAEDMLSGEKLSRVRVMTRPYADIILSKLLLLTKEYAKLAGVGEILLEKASRYPNALAEIYISIHLALALENLGRKEAAEKTLKEALALALPDKIYMPLAQNYEMLKPVLGRIELNEEERRSIEELHKLWRWGAEALKQLPEPVLTDRERETAVLVAQGLTNQEIAKRLFVSRETVKSILERAYKKTGTQSRVKLSTWLLLENGKKES